MSSDLTLITNEAGKTLRDRLALLLANATHNFDCLVGYFFLSGFHRLSPHLTEGEEIKSFDLFAKLTSKKAITGEDEEEESELEYPVGMMMEIVRARCALTPYFNDVHERTPCHFKRHAITP